MKTLAFAAFVLLSVAACSKSSGEGSASAGGGGGTAKKEEAKAGPKVIAITKLGLKGTAPGEQEDPLIGDGDPIMINAAFFSVTVAAAKETDAKTVDDGREEAKIFNPKNEKKEALTDGWALTFENTGSAGANYFVKVRREIGGKGYLCETMQGTEEQQKKALAFCKSLSKG